jgi:hypothetical protein
MADPVATARGSDTRSRNAYIQKYALLVNPRHFKWRRIGGMIFLTSEQLVFRQP